MAEAGSKENDFKASKIIWARRCFMISAVVLFIFSAYRIFLSEENNLNFEAGDIKTIPEEKKDLTVASVSDLTMINEHLFQDHWQAARVATDVPSSTNALENFRVGAVMAGEKGHVMLVDRQTGQIVFLERGQIFQGFRLEMVTSDVLIFMSGDQEIKMKL